MRSSQIAVAGRNRVLFGWKKERPDHRDLLLAPSPVVAPPSADLGKQCSPVEDQGDIGSCTANSSTSMMEALFIKQGRPLVELSRLFVYFYSRKIEGTPATEDSGCYIRDVMRCLAFYGAAREALWPYVVDKFSASPPFRAVQDARNHRILRYYRCPTLGDIKRSIAAGYTAVGGFTVPENMMSATCAKTGVVQFPAPTEPTVGGHAVHFVGYDDAKKLFKFQNSWGKTWGDKGFGYLPYDFVDRRMADDFWTVRQET